MKSTLPEKTAEPISTIDSPLETSRKLSLPDKVLHNVKMKISPQYRNTQDIIDRLDLKEDDSEKLKVYFKSYPDQEEKAFAILTEIKSFEPISPQSAGEEYGVWLRHKNDLKILLSQMDEFNPDFVFLYESDQIERRNNKLKNLLKDYPSAKKGDRVDNPIDNGAHQYYLRLKKDSKGLQFREESIAYINEIEEKQQRPSGLIDGFDE